MGLRSLAALAFAIAFSSVSASAQFFSFGVKAGVPLTDGLQSNSGSVYFNSAVFTTDVITNRYIIGPQAEVRLPFHLGIEADALYRHYSVSGSGLSQWEFPVLVKYRFRGLPLLHPFVDAGPIFNHLDSHIGIFPLSSASTGLVLGGGLDFHPIVLHITPEFRYIHWGGNGSAPVQQAQNQAEFLVGFGF